MKIKLLALDLDGTMLDQSSRLTEENRAAIGEAKRAGVEVMLVTGRSWRSAKEYYDELGLTSPAICYLGALVVEGRTGRVMRHRTLTEGAWSALQSLATAERLSVTACIGADQAVSEGILPDQELLAADTAFATCPADDFNGWLNWNPYTVLSPDLAPCTLPPTMAAVYGERAVRRVLNAFPAGLAETQFDLTDKIAGETVLHVWHADVDKGRALADFCRSRGIHPGEVAAFGDAVMDLSMIQYAGIGVAVPHADDPLRAAAQWVMDPAAAIYRILEEVK